MPTIDELIADWKRMRLDLARQLKLFESGRSGNIERMMGGTSDQTVAHLKRSIAELDALLSEHRSEKLPAAVP
jgi:hypothetical protein